MKKLGLTIGFCLVVFACFGQKKNVTDALKVAKDTRGNFADARTKIKSALQHPDTKDDAKTWYTAGQIENLQFDKENTKQLIGQQPNDVVMYNALYEIYPYFAKAYELDQMPDAKGKVKPKFTKDMKAITKINFPYYINGGVYFFQQEEFKRAYELFDQFIVVYDSPLMKDGEPAVAPVDSNYIWASYYAALAAFSLDHETSVNALKRATKVDFNRNESFQLLVQKYIDVEDKANLETTLVEALAVFPTDPIFLETLAITYIEQDKNDKALDYMLTAIKSNPSNARFYNVAGFIYENGFDDFNKAEENYRKAVEFDGENADYQYNLGRIYFNQGVVQLDIANDIADVKRYNEEKDKAKDFFRKSLPHFEKSFELNPDSVETKITLRSIYYNLDMGEKLDVMSKLLGDDD